jgi:hypothetical protein
MKNETNRDQLLFRMFEFALKEKFDHLARKYGRDRVFQIWVHWVRNEKMKTFPAGCIWKPDMTLSQALDRLDLYFAALEQMAQNLP